MQEELRAVSVFTLARVVEGLATLNSLLYKGFSSLF